MEGRMGKILPSWEEKFLEFFPGALARFTKSREAPHDGAHDRYRQRFIVRRDARSAARMGRALPRSARRGRRERRSSRNCPRTASNDSANAVFNSSGGCFFRAARSRWPTPKRFVREINERLVEIGDCAKNIGNSSLRAWYGFDPIHVKRRAHARSVAHVARRLARDGRTVRVRAIVAADDRLSGTLGAVGVVAIRFRAVRGATVRSIFRRHDDLVVLIVRARREAIVLRAMESSNARCTIRRAEKFLHEQKFFAKTCCTISTISYNYEQVTSVFTHFESQRVDEDIRFDCESKCELPELPRIGSWF